MANQFLNYTKSKYFDFYVKNVKFREFTNTTLKIVTFINSPLFLFYTAISDSVSNAARHDKVKLNGKYI